MIPGCGFLFRLKPGPPAIVAPPGHANHPECTGNWIYDFFACTAGVRILSECPRVAGAQGIRKGFAASQPAPDDTRRVLITTPPWLSAACWDDNEGVGRGRALASTRT